MSLECLLCKCALEEEDAVRYENGYAHHECYLIEEDDSLNALFI